MNKKQFVSLLIVVMFSSFLGGAAIQWFCDVPVIAQENIIQNEIKTKAIHLVDEKNKIRASFYLGIHDSPNLVLYDKQGTNRFNFGLAPAGNPGMNFNDEKFNKLIDIYTIDTTAGILLMNRKI